MQKQQKYLTSRQPQNKTPKFEIKSQSRNSHLRLKSQSTLDTLSRKQITILPSLKCYNHNSSKYIYEQHNSRVKRLFKNKNNNHHQNLKHLDGLTIMNDDFKLRNIVYQERFTFMKNMAIFCQIGFTQKFAYITIHQSKNDMNYKLRLTKQTGQAILNRFLTYNMKFKDHIFRDQLKKFYLSAPFPPFQRKFYFTYVHLNQIFEQEADEQDIFIRDRIKQLDRTQIIFGNIKELKKAL